MTIASPDMHPTWDQVQPLTGPTQVSSSSYLLPEPKLEDDAHGRAKIIPRGEKAENLCPIGIEMQNKIKTNELNLCQKTGDVYPKGALYPAVPMQTHLCAQSMVHRYGSELGMQLSSHAWYS